MDEAGITFKLLVALGAILLYPLGRCIYIVYLHPLARFPGPKLWAATRICYLKSLWAGDLTHDVRKIHLRYGDVVRIAPNELSFADPRAWDDIYGARHRYGLMKSPIWHNAPGRPKSILNAFDNQDHTRIRKAVQPAFTERAIKEQESIVQSHVNLLIYKLEEAVEAHPDSDGVDIDVVRWYNFTTFDIIGDLGFGESFDCLKKSEYHAYVAIISPSFKEYVLRASLQFYPKLAWLINQHVPKSTRNKQQQLSAMANDKLNRRLRSEKTRSDFIFHIKRQKEFGTGEGISLQELKATSAVIITAGSETTTSVLTGTTDYLLRDRTKLTLLKDEVRTTFSNESDMTFESLARLQYLHAVIQEGLRLCNPNPAGHPRVVSEGGASVCGHWLPAGTALTVHPFSLSRSPSRFHLPEEFIPERWLKSSREDPASPFHGDDRTAVQAFGAGARDCIGKQLAWHELRLILARMVWAFDVTDAKEPRLEWEKHKTWMLIDKGTMPVRLKAKTARQISSAA